MTQGSNEQDLIFRAKFEDDASEDLEGLGENVEELDSGMNSLSLSTVTAGLAMFGAGIGANKLVGDVLAANTAIKGTNFTFGLLPESAQNALDGMSEAFAGIGSELAQTDEEVRAMAVNITASSGGIVPSIDELRFAFQLARLRGLDLGAAADIVGQALQGNEEPLNTLLDPGGRSYISLPTAMADAALAFEGMITPVDRVTAAYRNQIDVMATTEGQYKTLLEAILPLPALLVEVTGLWDKFWNAVTGEDSDIPGAFNVPAPPTGAAGQINEADIQRQIEQGIFGVGAAGAGAAFLGIPPIGSIGITINGDVDSAQRAAIIARQIELQIRNIYRGSINTLVTSPFAFPS